MSILIVDDSELSRCYLADMLRDAGYDDLVYAGSAEDAFRKVDMSLQGAAVSPVDLILLDINLPQKNGIEACRDLKAVPHLADIPVIIISAVEQIEGLEAAFTAGAMDYISKPPDQVELLARVRSALRLKSEMDRRKARERELLILNEQLEVLNRQLELMAVTDSLTGLANRRSFNEFILREWRRAFRDVTPLAVLMIDIDHFKNYNDSEGHLAGDVCLQQVAMALQRGLKRPADLLARYGGEEFVVVLPETDMAGAILLAETLRHEIEILALPHPASSVANIVTVSIGVAVLDQRRDMNSEQTLDRADQALYQAKKDGRNCTVAAPASQSLLC